MKDRLRIEIAVERDNDGMYEGTVLFIDDQYEMSSILYSEVVDYLNKYLINEVQKCIKAHIKKAGDTNERR